MSVVARPFNPRLELLDRPALEALQARKLRALVERAEAVDGMYAQRWRAAGVASADIRTVDDIRRLPLVTKEEMIADQDAAPPFGTRLLVDESEIARLATSGGSSGGGKEQVAHTRQDLLLLGRLQGTAFRWGGIDPDDVCVFHIPIVNSTASLAFPLGVEAAGRIKYLIGHEGFGERLELMLAHGARGMWGSPSTVNGFTEDVLRRGIDPRKAFPGFKTVVIAAENYVIPWAERIADAWGARVVEGYGATQTHGAYCFSTCELGLIGVEGRGTMHGYEWAFVLEVIDPVTLEPVAPGESGELVVTTLDKRASPTIRYRTGDRVTVVPGPCACGRQTLLLEAGTIGRYDDMLKVKGSNIWPDRVDEVLLAIDGLRDYSATVVISERGRDEIEIRFATARQGLDDAVAGAIRERFKATFSVTVRTAAVAYEQLEIRYGEGGKARRWRDRRVEMLGRRGLESS